MIFGYSCKSINDRSLSQSKDAENATENNLKIIEIANLPLFFGIAAFNFDSSTLVLPMYKSAKRPELFIRTFKTVSYSVILLCIIMGVSGYAVRV